MDKAAILDLLREHLKISISTSEFSDWGSKGIRVHVELLLDDECITQAEDTFDMAIRDTSENWRNTFDTQ